MRRKAVCLCLSLVVAVVCLGRSWADSPQPAGSTGKERAEFVANTISALHQGGVRLKDRDRCNNDNLTWVEIKFYDEQYPLTLNVVSMKRPNPCKVIYLLAASSLNFKSSFFTPIENSLASYLAQQGYLVVGITPREDNVPPEADPSVMEKWGMRKHREDVRKIIRLVQANVDKPYQVLGHSLGAIIALDYAGEYADKQFRSVTLLDIPSFDPKQQDYADKMASARQALHAYHTLLDANIYEETSVVDYKRLLAVATNYPTFDSKLPRAYVVPGMPGNFTIAGLLHFGLIFTAYMPGLITPYTDSYLPQEWPMVQGNAAGTYVLNDDPLKDTFGLKLSDLDQLGQAAAEVGSGIVPVALLRDYTSSIAELGDYRIHWAGIQEKVLWINGGLGMGYQTYGAELIRSLANNHKVTVAVVPGYGHVDLIYSKTARKDVWSRLLTQ
jgi:pimeloyl-ACP methyl ester carboxylesterase